MANTLAVRNVTVVVLDVKPIVTENCEGHRRIPPEVAEGMFTDISYYQCDVSDWEQVKKVAEAVIEEVWSWYHLMVRF